MSDRTFGPPATRALLAVFDGLRPDMVGPDLTPNILRLAARGTWFTDSRTVFPPVTRVATTALATGSPPGVHGVVNNQFLFPAAVPDRLLDTSSRADLLRAEAASPGGFVTAETFADVLAKAGRRVALVHTGSAGSAYLFNPRAAANGHWTFSIHGPEATGTPQAFADVQRRFGPPPARALPLLADAAYAARVVTEHVLPVLAPDVAAIWFNEPDTTYHFRGIGSADAREAIRHADAAFGTILDAVEAGPDAERFAVLVASDHGQVTVGAISDLREALARDGFGLGHSGRGGEATFSVTGGRSGEVRLVSGFQSDLARVAAWLSERDDVSHLFAAGEGGAIPQALPLHAIGLGHPRGPDLVYVLRSDPGPDRYGLPGTGLVSAGDVGVGGGQHGGLDDRELNNLLIVAAPGYDAGGRSGAPAGIVDIAPTLLGLLGEASAPAMVGRDLTREPRGEPHRSMLSARLGSREQHVEVVDEDGRRFILGAR